MSYRQDSYTGSTTAINLCSVAQVCQYLGIATSASLTGFISTTIDRVSKQFENYCDNSLKEQSFIGHYDSDGTNVLQLQHYPIVSVTSIKYRNSPLEGYTNTIATSACSIFYDKIKSYNTYFPCGDLSIEIVYNAGYSIVPQDLEQITVEAVAEIIRESSADSGNTGLTDSRLGKENRDTGSTNERFISLTPRHKEVLNHYKKI